MYDLNELKRIVIGFVVRGLVRVLMVLAFFALVAWYLLTEVVS